MAEPVVDKKHTAQARYKTARTTWLIQMVRKHEKKPDSDGINYAKRLSEFNEQHENETQTADIDTGSGYGSALRAAAEI